MSAWTAIALSLCASSLLAFGWGMARFFDKPSGGVAGTSLVGVLGCSFAAWHLWSIAVSAPSRSRGVAAVCLYGVALGLFGWAVRACRGRTMTAIFETDVPRHLVREGPYGYVRHPFYTAYTLFWTAGWLASGSHVALASVVVMGAVYVRAAAREEAKFRASPLAAAHEDYCRRTGGTLPRLGWRR